MGNCLVKKLQTTVEDENLLGLGEILFSLNNREGGYVNGLRFNTTSNHSVQVKSGSITLNEIIYNAGDYIVQNVNSSVIATIISLNNCVLSYKNLYNIEEISIPINMFKSGIDIYDYLQLKIKAPNIKYLDVSQGLYIVHLEKFTQSQLNSIELVELFNNNNITGFKDFLLNAPNLYCYGLCTWSIGNPLTWESETLRNTDYPILVSSYDTRFGLVFASKTDCDNYLINMSNSRPLNNIQMKNMIVSRRTTASNQAVLKLKENGYKVYTYNDRNKGILNTGNETQEELDVMGVI